MWVFVVWFVGALSAGLGVAMTLHPPSQKAKKVYWLVFGVLTVFGFFIARYEKKEQEERVDLETRLTKSNEGLKEVVGSLVKDLPPALANLGQARDGKEFNATLQKLSDIADADRDYHDIAILNMIGKPGPDGDLVYNSPISKSLEGAYVINGIHITYKEDAEAEQKFRDTIALDPRFPFSYLGLATVLYRRGDIRWREYATKGEAICEKTILVPGHHPNHDLCLKYVKEMLAH